MLVSSWLSWLHNARFLVNKMVNSDHRGVYARRIIFSRAGEGPAEVVARWPRICREPLLRSDAMFNSLATDASKSEPRLAHSERADSDGPKQPPLPGTPYAPYSEKPAVPELPYKPYAEKPAHEAPYEPYKGI
jgi:hypothetical protein